MAAHIIMHVVSGKNKSSGKSISKKSRVQGILFEQFGAINCSIIIIRGHLVALFVADMTPFTGWAEHLGGLACMQSVPLEWEDS